VKLTKDINGSYLWGSPSAGAPASVWGLTPVVDTNLAAGFVVGDFTSRSIELLMREEVLTELSREHQDYFTKNLVAIRTEARAANGLYRPSAFAVGSFPAVPPATLSANRK
jgi:HK97 family phage major capsid protein